MSSKLTHQFLFCADSSHWYVSGYCLSFPDPTNEESIESLLRDAPPEYTMFRIVVKSNLTIALAEDLADQIDKVIPIMDSMENGYTSILSVEDSSESFAFGMPSLVRAETAPIRFGGIGEDQPYKDRRMSTTANNRRMSRFSLVAGRRFSTHLAAC